MTNDIYVTRPYLPPLEEFETYLGRIWNSGMLSNCGPFHQQLERALCDYLDVPHIAVFNNGTIALICALKALGIEGEVITTPFSFVATSHAIMWTRSTPVFVDIDPVSLNLDPSKIEAAITDRTKAIMPVHCYGHPAESAEIDAIAQKHGLKVIYDAAHAFGVKRQNESVLNAGDLSVLSFHATKVFNTFEGGAIVCSSQAQKTYIDKLKNFGHDGEVDVLEIGLNGKLSEVNSAFGLLQLEHVHEAIARRSEIDAAYREGLKNIPGVTCIPVLQNETPNYAYFPILIGPEFPVSRDQLVSTMKASGVHPRRYFFPLIPEFPMYEHLPSADLSRLPHAYTASRQILCLPIYPDLDSDSVQRVIASVAGA